MSAALASAMPAFDSSYRSERKRMRKGIAMAVQNGEIMINLHSTTSCVEMLTAHRVEGHGSTRGRRLEALPAAELVPGDHGHGDEPADEI